MIKTESSVLVEKFPRSQTTLSLSLSHEVTDTKALRRYIPNELKKIYKKKKRTDILTYLSNFLEKTNLKCQPPKDNEPAKPSTQDGLLNKNQNTRNNQFICQKIIDSD